MAASAADPSHEGPPHPASEPPHPTWASAHVGEVIANRFRLVARIHTSSTGAIYRAEDLSLARPVALRLLTPILSRDAALLERLQNRLQASMRMARDEVRVLGDIIDLIDLGRSDSGQVFVVTDFVNGENLAEQLTRDGPLPWPSLRPLMVRACQILHLSHEHGVVRLDLQTRHLFPVRDKTQTSTLKILSPGLQLDPALSPEMIRYAAPEQITRTACDRRTDIYALGVIMYELLTGQVPFADAVPAVILARHLLEPPPPLPAHLLEAIPPAALAIVHRALAKQPADRWPTMRAMANAMAAIDFGPCDVSGMLEVVDGEPVLPSTSSASMHIDASASHGATPSVRPRTFPPLQDAFTDRQPADHIPAQPELPDPDSSSSRLAWEEILAAAEEAIATVAGGDHSGTAGDSGVFQPERMLHTGEAASASQMRGRRPVARPEPSLAETLVLPIVHPDWPTEPTMQLGPEDLLAASTASLIRPPLQYLGADELVTASYPAIPAEPPPPDLPAAVTAALSPTLAATPTAGESVPQTHSGEHPDDSTATLRVATPAERSAAAAIVPPQDRSPWLAWAAGILLLVAGAAVIARMGGPDASPNLSDGTVADRTPRRPTPNLSPGTAAKAEPAQPTRGPADLSPGTATNAEPAQPTRDPADLSPGTATAADPNLPSGTGPATPSDLSPGTATNPPTAPAAAPVTAVTPPAVPTPPIDLAPGTGDPPNDPPAKQPRPAEPRPRPARAKPAPPEPQPTPQRRSAPGAQLPDAGLEPPPTQDPLHAADLLRSAEQSAARGEHGQALGLATRSFHTAPSTRALQVAGESACRLGNVGKARWARQHLSAADRQPVEAACKAAGVALD